MRKIGLGLSAMLLASMLGFAPVLATTAAGTASNNGNRSVTFDTALTPDYYGVGEFDGVLHLTFEPGGIVNGWYRSVDAGSVRDVVGGLDGDKLWLDLGTDGLRHINATYDGGKIEGGTYSGNQAYTFVATPTTKQL